MTGTSVIDSSWTGTDPQQLLPMRQQETDGTRAAATAAAELIDSVQWVITQLRELGDAFNRGALHGQLHVTKAVSMRRCIERATTLARGVAAARAMSRGLPPSSPPTTPISLTA